MKLIKPKTETLKVTGVALQKVRAADKAAEEHYQKMDKVIESLDSLLEVKELDAAYMVFALGMYEAYVSLTNVNHLVPRHRGYSIEYDVVYQNSSQYPKEALKACGKRLYKNLVDAGVDLPEFENTIDFWKAAAGIGC